MRLLLDTHIWIWYLAGDPRLTEYEREAIDSSENEIFLSPISIWETLLLAEKGRIELGPSPDRWVRTALAEFATIETPVNAEIAIVSRSITLPHPDPADRFLAATAEVYKAALVTQDRRLLDSESVNTFH